MAEVNNSVVDLKLTEIKKRINDAFDVFDRDGSKKISTRDVGTVIRSLDCFPSEAELLEVYRELDDEDTPGIVKYDKFLAFMMKAVLEIKYRPATKRMLTSAFKVIDAENKGFITVEKLRKLFMEEGEPFTQEEFDEMMSVAATNDVVNYNEYLHFIAHEGFKASF